MADKRKRTKVKPEVLKGFRDYPPAEQIAREAMLATVRESLELNGFLPLQTPSLEFAATLLGDHYTSETLGELFGFTGPEETEMALRYEFTVSLARFVAANQQDLPLPFRRYQYGNVWRVDKPGPGRYREFMQFDIDIIGTRNRLADAEIIATMVATLDRLEIERFSVRFSHREMLNGVIAWASVAPERATDVMRVIDKLEKQGEEAVLLELGPGRVDSSGDRIPGLGLSEEQIARLRDFLQLAPSVTHQSLQSIVELTNDNEQVVTGCRELTEIVEALDALGSNQSQFRIDPTIVRGLGYYTGPVFETTLDDLPDYGSVFSGGRYDNLVERFLNRSIPAVGASIGVDRLLAALKHLGALREQAATAVALVTVMDPERITDYLAMVAELRSAGLATELYVGDTRNISKQVRYADRVGIPFAIIAGSDEFASGQVTVKNLARGREQAAAASDRDEWLKAAGFQETIARADLIPFLRKQLNSRD